MIQRLSTGHSKKIAAFLFLLFYTEFCCCYRAIAANNHGSIIRSIPDHSFYTGVNKPVTGISFTSAKPASQLEKTGLFEKNILHRQKAIINNRIGKSANKTFSGGPGQPEMQSFQSVNTGNMVDLFSGDFSYNIPLMDVGGYPVNLHYRSGISMDQEASWVGLGWNINPGTITRNMRGIPDDFNGQDIITKTLSVKKNWTAGVNVGFSTEIFGYDVSQALGLGINGSIFYNNYKGIGFSTGTNISITGGMGSKGSLTGGLSIANNSQSGFNVSPSFEIGLKNKDGNGSTAFSVGTSYSTRAGLQALTVNVKGKRKTDIDEKNLRLGNFNLSSSISFLHQAYTPTIQVPFTNVYTSLSVKFGTELFGAEASATIGGFFSEQYIAKNDRIRKSPAYGYLYLQQQANDADPNALLDFNREKELTYRESPATPHLAIPIYTHDIYSISGEGTGGMFRPYRSDIGYLHDQNVKSKSVSASLGLELGGGNLIHGGGNIEPSISTTESNIWTGSNELKKVIPYRSNDGNFEAVYFRNPAEKTINTQDFYDNIGDTDPMLPLLDNNDDPILTRKMQPYKKMQLDGAAKIFTSNTIKSTRDKRTQVISYLNAGVASNYALDKTILLYPENSFYANKCTIPASVLAQRTEPRVNEFRKAHHLSEIIVLNNDGRRYTYGLPVYNTKQVDVSFSVDKNNADAATGLVGYTPGQNSPKVSVQNTDNYYSKEEIPGYAHSFMLTGILSSDYVDRLEDGITDDDQGDAVKFNYSRIFGNNNSNFYKWRTPFAQNKATYNEGLKTDIRDDKGSYIYGEKEIVYLNSVESKTMIAVFTLNNALTETRKDGYELLDENGAIDLNPSNTLRYLKKIDLYAKADFLKNGQAAKPIKTVNFDYGYDLCRKNPSSVNGEGKLTLKKVWFTYYGNQKGALNPYQFYYHPTNIADKNNSNPDPKFNPEYHPKKYDRWGNYKNISDNPSGLDNADYPYAVQDAVKANDNASAWTMTDVRLPSGGRLNVEYESDDYAYVQNKRSAVMSQIAGFGNSEQLSTGSDLYKNIGLVSPNDNHYVFIKVAEAVSSKTEVLQKYLEGMDKLYFRLRVKMPTDVYGNGYEQVTTYARIEDYGTTSDPNTIWVKLQGTGDIRPNLEKESPLAKTALQMLRLNMPSKAYPGSDVGSTVNPEAVIRSMVGYITSYTDLFNKYADMARGSEWAKETDLNACFVRLNNPSYKKYGGGLRVKKVVVYDNWTAMTGQKEATYGQEYIYTTTKKINGADKVISSGVAAYEPTIGGEENPFRLPVEYDEQIAPLAPVNNMYSEEPLGESYFPSASVGYSKVRVHTINAKNIKSATGFEETEFYTTYDFPTLVDKTVLDERKYKPSILGQIFKINARRYLTQAQGFSVETTDMDGKMKASASYPENDPTNALAYTKYYYQADDDKPEQKHLNNTVSVVTGADGLVNAAAQVGKSVEMVVDFREQRSVTQGFVAAINADGFLVGPLPITAVIPYGYPQYEENRYRSVATLKLVQRYGILNKVEHYEKGSKVTTENLLYDAETGETVLSKVENEFKDPVYSFNYPAHWAYSGMGMAYKNIGATFSGITITDGKITNAGLYENIESNFESGDEVMLTGITNLKRNTLEPNCDGEITVCTALTPNGNPILKAWAVTQDKIQKDNGITGLRFIDENGKLISTAGIQMTILRSGKRNITTASAGSITSLENPLKMVGQDNRIVYDATTKVLNAAATSFKDYWKVEDAQYKPVVYQTSTNALQRVVLHPAYSFAISHEGNGSGKSYGGPVASGSPSFYNRFIALLQTPYVEMAEKYGGGGDFLRTELHSWMNFDLRAAGIPSDAIIVNANLKLYPHFQDHNERPAAGLEDKNHTSIDPHFDTRDVSVSLYENQGYLYFDNNAELQKVDVPAALTDNSARTQSIMLNNRNASNDNCPGCALVRATNLQAGYNINLKSQLATELPFYTNNGNPNGSWLRLVNAATHDRNGRLCFWSVDSKTQGIDCSIYSDLPDISQTTSANNTRSTAANISQTGSANNIQLLTTPNCTYCSIVDNGSGKTFCSTAPELTIDYLPLCANGQQPVEICGKFYCSTTVDPACTSYILDTAVNPYRFGILGNWRMNRAYTYFDTRKETNPATATDIRNNGVAANFVPYWTLSSPLLQPTTDTTKWVWNSEMTLFNRKGFEIENRDPLGRYNAVQYGYNQTLPVAVSQNARYTDQAFEGFEDADYDNSGCAKPCAIPRHFTITDKLATKRTSNQAHTGKYSLMLNAGETITTNINLRTTGTVDLADTLWYKVDTANLFTKSVVPKGKGLTGDYYKLTTTDYFLDKKPTGTPNASVLDDNFNFYKTDQQISAAGVAAWYFVRWRGAVQVAQTGIHTFKSQESDNAFRLFVTIDGQEKLIVNDWQNHPRYPTGASGQVYLKKGELYPVRLEFNQGDGPHALHLSLDGLPLNGTNLPGIFYPFTYTKADTAGSVNSQNLGVCINPEGVRVTKQIIYNGFMPAAETKYLVGAWVKEQAINSTGSDYKNVLIKAAFYDKDGFLISGSTVDCKPAGVIIEGWQRIEEFVTMPKDAIKLQLSFISLVPSGTANGAVYFDDVRMHPFNANMKSFVYNPVDIKLMAELDENNYASFYEYDDEGTLIRVKKETERGIKTIRETRSALIKENQ